MSFAAVSGYQPHNLAAPSGDYWNVIVAPGPAVNDIYVQHSAALDFSTTAVAATNTGDCTEPCLARLPWGRLLLDYVRTDGMGVERVYERASDDEGATWGTETLLVTDGDQVGYHHARHPQIVVDGTGTILRTYWAMINGFEEPGFDGQLFGTLQYPGDVAPGTPFTLADNVALPLDLADEFYRIAWHPRGVWYLHYTTTSHTGTLLLQSADEGKTWIVAGGWVDNTHPSYHAHHPGVAVGTDGFLLLWGLEPVFGTLLSQSIAPGIAPNEPSHVVLPLPAVVTDAASAGITTSPDRSSFAHAFEGPARWMLLADNGDTGFLKTSYSADDGKSAALFP